MRSIFRAVAGIVIAAALTYAADTAWVWLRMANHNDPTGTVQVRVLLAVPLKNGRTAYTPGATETRTCVHSLFPHASLEPCWYAVRHTRKQVNY